MGAAHLHATVSGTATLTIAKADKSSTVVYYHKAPNYGGKIIGKTEVRYFDRGRWADSYEGSAVVYFMMTGNVEITASELLPSGYSNTAWDPNTVWCRQDGLDLQNNPTYGYLLYDTDNWTCGGVGPMLSAARPYADYPPGRKVGDRPLGRIAQSYPRCARLPQRPCFVL